MGTLQPSFGTPMTGSWASLSQPQRQWLAERTDAGTGDQHTLQASARTRASSQAALPPLGSTECGWARRCWGWGQGPGLHLQASLFIQGVEMELAVGRQRNPWETEEGPGEGQAKH